MEILASYNGLYFHPGSRHCIQSSTVLPAFTQRPWPGTSLGTAHCGHLTVSLCGSLLCSKLSRAPPLTHWCPEWSALPSSKSALHATWTDLCSLTNTTSFWFCSCCSILPAHLPPNSYCHNAIASQGLSWNPLLPWRGPQLILHQVIPFPVASCLTFSDLRVLTVGAVTGPSNLQQGSLLLHPAAGGLASSQVQGRWCHSCALAMPLVPTPFRARPSPYKAPQPCKTTTDPVPWLPFPHPGLGQGLLPVSSLRVLSYRSRPDNRTLGSFPIPCNGVFLPQLPTRLPLTSDLVSWKASLKCSRILHGHVLTK